MLPNLNDIQVAEEHRKDLLREAARRRQNAEIAAALRGQRRQRRPFYLRALAGLGRRLVAWGAWLQGLEVVEAGR